MNVVQYKQTSPYFNTPQISNYVDYLDYWRGTYILPQSSDQLMQLDAGYQYRPDLLAFAQYGTTSLWWIFMLRNPNVIKDPIWDFVANIMIYVPQKDTLTRFL